MAFMAIAKTAGKHTAKALEAHNAARAAEAQAMQDPAAAASIAEAEKAKTRRSRNRLIAGVTVLAMSGAAVYVGASKIENGISKAWDALKSGTPKPVMSVQIQNVLKSVKLPNEAVVVEGHGTSSVSLHGRSEASMPVLGTLWNHTVAHLTDSTASVTREGDVQLLAQQNGIHLKGVKTAKGWGIEADVDASAITSQRANMQYAVDSKTGKRELHANDDVFVFSGQGGRVANVTDWADKSFGNSCSEALLPALTGGIQKLVSTEVSLAAQLEASTGHKANAALLQKVGEQPVAVSIRALDDTYRHGNFRTRAIEPTSIELPQTTLPISTKDMDVSYDSQCSVTPIAMEQMLQIVTAEHGGAQ